MRALGTYILPLRRSDRLLCWLCCCLSISDPFCAQASDEMAARPPSGPDAICGPWIQVAGPMTVDDGLLWKSLLLAALLLALSHNWRLRREMVVRERTERILADSERHYRELVEAVGSSGFHLYSLAPDGTFVYASPMSAAEFGVAPDVLVGRRWDAALDLTEATREKFAAAFAQCLRGEIPLPVLIESRGPTGSRHFLSHPRPVRGEQVVTVRVEGIAVNLTERLQLEEDLRRAVAEARTAGQIKSDFLASMSHEIRTPMNTVIGMIHLCLEAGPTERQREYLESARRASQSLLRLLNDVLDLSKAEAGRVTLESAPFSLRNRVVGLAEMAEDKLSGQGTVVDLEIDPAVPDIVVGDVLRLDQILVNLVDNAIKFTEQGWICLRIRVLGAGEGRIHLEFEVEDTGIGIAPDQIGNLFEPFRQADSSITRRYGGTGLGLSICKHLVELMGGSIGVESVLGAGSRLRFDVWFGGQPVADTHVRSARILLDDLGDGEGIAAADARATLATGEPAGQRDALLPLLQELAGMLVAHDPMAEDFSGEHRRALASALPPALFATLSKQVREYRFDDALVTLNACSRTLESATCNRQNSS